MESADSNPLISVIIPVYNAEKYLRRSLDSLLAQDFGQWEAICVDDGSQDGSSALLDEYATADSRFVVIHQENTGVAAARNHGLDQARGKLLIFLDADDWYAPEAFGIYSRALQDGGADIACSAYIRQYDDREPEVFEKYKRMPSGIKPVDRRSLGRIVCCGWGKAYRKEIVETNRLRFQEGMKMGEDALFVYHYLAHCRNVALIPTPLYNYFLNENSALQQGIHGRYPLEVYDQNIRVPLLASDYMRKVVSERRRRLEYDYFFLQHALRERDLWKQQTKEEPILNRELMRRALRYVLVLAARTTSISAWYLLSTYLSRPLLQRVRNSIRYRLNKYLGFCAR